MEKTLDFQISAVIPAFNEEKTIGDIVSRSLRHVDEVLVIDDGSTDETGIIAEREGAKVIRNAENQGILNSLRRGFEAAKGDILVTLDADGQHDPDQIPVLVEQIIADRSDLVLGKRAKLPYISERVIAKLTSLRVPVRDASTGFRAIRKDIAKKMILYGSCTCGTFILEAASLGARVSEVDIGIKERQAGDRKIKTNHLKQIFTILYFLLRYPTPRI